MINILKASAGSGKTFNLAKTYIEILLKSKERYTYRSVLAVTFTNKATAEMKNRILRELAQLARDPQKSSYFKDFVPAIVPDAALLRDRARAILTDILHDYGAFSISTIDRFFQQTLKAFSREIGQFSSYQIELDRASLVRESVDRILDSLTENDRQLVDWLNASVSEQLEKGAKVDLEKSLYEMANRLSSEEHRDLNEKYGLDDKVTFSKDRLSSLRKECQGAIGSFEKLCAERAQAVIAIMDECGVPLEATYRSFLTKIREYAAPEEGVVLKQPTEAFVRKSLNSKEWFSKDNAKKYLSSVEYRLAPALESFCALFKTEFKVYNTAILLKSQAYSLGLASEFYSEYEALLKEKNVLGIDDSNTILRRIIDGSDAPFVYEKLGVRLQHFLLDEFQDTSNVQWLNFLPLLRESDAYDNTDLVVGDVKQSIYRWRGSEWDLLDKGISEEFSGASVRALEENWRSTRAVVDFNNRFFAYAADALDRIAGEDGPGISRIYADVAQRAMSKDPQYGSVNVEFCSIEDELPRVIEAVNSAHDRGADWGDIAILVRNNKEGGEAAYALIDAGIPVLSDDSLDVKASVVVRRLVALLKCVDNPDDSINSYLVSELGVTFPDRYHSLVDLCEGILRSLRAHDEALFKGETLYIQSFMDVLLDWTARNGNNLMYFLRYWADTQFKVSSPADTGAVRILTIHKSKGLEFPLVIFPYAEQVTLRGRGFHWFRPESGSEELSLAGEGIFPVDMKEALADTLFAGEYQRERQREIVDAINMFYVALTRAGKELHVIASTPSAEFATTVEAGGSCKVTDMSQLLYSFVGGSDYQDGEPYDYGKMERKAVDDVTAVEAEYHSIPINGAMTPSDDDTPVGEQGRLKFSVDSVDFFGDDGSTGTSASHRLRGIVLHDILSRVEVVDDLEKAVGDAVYLGKLSTDEGEAALQLLRERISSAASRGWFGSRGELAAVSNEQSLIGTDGQLHRPDRVVQTGSGDVIVIDYKFGEPKRVYASQVAEYVSLYRQMGYERVSGYLWYVAEDKVVPVSV